ncbi:MAG: hypothetical protein U0531_00745 [Dehalococcoidia bacterium]
MARRPPGATPVTGAVGNARPVRFDAEGEAVNNHTYGRPGPTPSSWWPIGREAEVWGEPARELAAAGFYVLAFAPEQARGDGGRDRRRAPFRARAGRGEGRVIGEAR